MKHISCYYNYIHHIHLGIYCIAILRNLSVTSCIELWSKHRVTTVVLLYGFNQQNIVQKYYRNTQQYTSIFIIRCHYVMKNTTSL